MTLCIVMALVSAEATFNTGAIVSRKSRTFSSNGRPDWAARIERLRDRLQFSQTELARKLHVSAMAISRWERGVNEPPSHSYIALGKLAGIDGCWYFWERAGITKADARRMLD